MIALLGIYSEKNMAPKDICTPMFIAVLFTIAKTWKQPKHLSTGKWIKKMGDKWIMGTMGKWIKNKISHATQHGQKT